MRPVVLGPVPATAGNADPRLDWCVRAIQDIALASQQDDPNVVADGVTLTNITTRLTLDGAQTVTTLGQAQTEIRNLANTLGTFLNSLKKRGAKRTQ